MHFSGFNSVMRTVFSSLALGLLVSATAFAALNPVNKTDKGLALDGYDAVAYFMKQQAVRGNRNFTLEWNGATWRFSTLANKETFEKNPQRYAPQFGGYCSWAVGHNYTANGDPEAWTIIDNKLYLNYDKSVREMWLKEIPDLIKKGERNWPRLLKK